MASLFGAPWNLGQGAVQGSPGPGGGPVGGGFPGAFPGAGVSNSGWAGFGGIFGAVGPCSEDDLKTGRCVMGPRADMSGKR